MTRKRVLFPLLALCALFGLPSCGGGGGGGGTAQTGTLSVGLTDASTDDYKAVYVTISEVQVHVTADAWKVVASPNKTYNLLDLVNGVREQLGIAELDAGKYTEMRLIIGETPDGGINILRKKHPYANYVIIKNPDDTVTVHELKIPSGYQIGVKIVQGFTINANQATELILDFSALESVVVAGNSGKWLLKPTIKVLNTEEWSIVGGTVHDDQDRALEGVLVSAQIYTPPPQSFPPNYDINNEVITETSTVTDETGQYRIFIKFGTYNIVAYSTGYSPAVECSVVLDPGEVFENPDLQLQTLSGGTETGTVYGPVTITGADADQYATISFRQPVDCDGTEKEFEVKSINVGNSGNYDIRLPVGFYDVVVSTYGKASIIYKDVEINADEPYNLAINI